MNLNYLDAYILQNIQNCFELFQLTDSGPQMSSMERSLLKYLLP